MPVNVWKAKKGMATVSEAVAKGGGGMAAVSEIGPLRGRSGPKKTVTD